MTPRSLIVVASALLLLGCGLLGQEDVAPTPTYTIPCDEPLYAYSPVWSPDGQHIAYIMQVPQLTDPGILWDEIYVMNSDGTSPVQLTAGPNGKGSFQPAWSPDGRQIAYASLRNDSMEIYVMNSDGSGQKQLTTGFTWVYRLHPSWSPDGRQIIYEGEGILSTDTNGRSPTFLGDGSSYELSPDGKHITYEKSHGDSTQIYVMNADGANPIPLTQFVWFYDARPHWSPDGTLIAFSSEEGKNRDIYVINADGSGRVRLTDNPGPDEGPVWSPDGKHIAFESLHDNSPWGIYVMSSDGSGQTRLAGGSDEFGAASAPAWSPDGSRIAFVSSRDYGPTEIYVMNSDGSNQTRLTSMATTPACTLTASP